MFPVTSGSRSCATLRLRLSTRRNRQVAGLRIPVDLVHDRGSPATSRRASACAPAFPCLVWSRSFAFAFCLAFLVMLDTPDPMATTAFRQKRFLPISLAAERRMRPFCTTTHTRPVNCSDSSRRCRAAESTSVRPDLAAEFDEALLLIDVVSVAHLFFIAQCV